MTTCLLHLVGPQGCGKSTLARFIVSGLNASGTSASAIDYDSCCELTNAQLRRQFAAFDVVVVEDIRLMPRHNELAPGDEVWSFTARG